MYQNDLVGVILVYLYVTILLIISEKIMKKYPVYGRKFLHIMTGNIAFLLPIFLTKEIMAFLAAGPFIIFTFLMSPHSPIRSVKGKTSAAGHGMGLVYYAISWTILAYVFFDSKLVIAIGILAMSYGDGFASLLGSKFGKIKFKIFGNYKSLLGSFSMLVFSYITFIIALIYYDFSIDFILLGILILIAFCGMIIELLTPKGFDNLTVPIVASLLFYYAFII